MLRAPSVVAPFALRGPDLLGVLRRLVLAIATIIGCAAIGTVELERPAPCESAAEESSESSHHVRDGAEHEGLKAVEADLDDDDDDDDSTRDHVDHSNADPHRIFVAHHRNCAWRGDLPCDTSRFAAGTGLPRGPPA